VKTSELLARLQVAVRDTPALLDAEVRLAANVWTSDPSSAPVLDRVLVGGQDQSVIMADQLGWRGSEQADLAKHRVL
jgi:hypothetical protein